MQGQPAFFVSYDFNREEDSKKIIYQNSKKKCKIDINATRNPVSNLYLRIIHFYLVEYEHSSSNQNSGTYKLIPIRGLFTTPDFKIGRANTSMAFIIRGDNKCFKGGNLGDLRKFVKNNGATKNKYIKIVMKIGYIDIFGDSHIKYINILEGITHVISPNLGRCYFDEYVKSEKIGAMVDLNHTSLKKLQKSKNYKNLRGHIKSDNTVKFMT